MAGLRPLYIGTALGVAMGIEFIVSSVMLPIVLTRAGASRFNRPLKALFFIVLFTIVLLTGVFFLSGRFGNGVGFSPSVFVVASLLLAETGIIGFRIFPSPWRFLPLLLTCTGIVI